MPHWELTDGEARGIGKAIRDATRHFDIRTSDKVTDLLMLVSTVGFAYGPRVIMTAQLLKARQAGPQGVTPMSPVPAPNGFAQPPEPIPDTQVFQ